MKEKDVVDVYEFVYSHLLACSDELYNNFFENSLLYLEIKCLMNFIKDLI